MTFEERLNRAAERYKAQGYQVVLRPGPDVLPPFAKDFKVEILATGGDGNVLASAKESAADLEADPNVPLYAEVTNKQPGWRFDLFILGTDTEVRPEQRDAREPSEEDIRRSLAEVEQLLRAGFVAPSLLAAWGVLESALRRKVRAAGRKAGWETSPRTLLNELYSSGALSTTVFRELERLYQLRTAIVHGFTAPVDPGAVQFLVDTACRFLEESQPTRQTA